MHHQTHRCSKPWSSRSKAIPAAMRWGVSADNTPGHRENVRPGRRRGHPNEPPARTSTATPHPEDARLARRAGGLPDRRHRPSPGRVGNPRPPNAFFCTGTAAPAPRRSARAPPAVGHRGDPGRNDRPVRRHHSHHPGARTPSLGPPSSGHPRTPRQHTKPRSLAATQHATMHDTRPAAAEGVTRAWGERDPQRLLHGITARHVTQTASAARTGPAGCETTGWPPG